MAFPGDIHQLLSDQHILEPNLYKIQNRTKNCHRGICTMNMLLTDQGKVQWIDTRGLDRV